MELLRRLWRPYLLVGLIVCIVYVVGMTVLFSKVVHANPTYTNADITAMLNEPQSKKEVRHSRAVGKSRPGKIDCDEAKSFQTKSGVGHQETCIELDDSFKLWNDMFAPQENTPGVITQVIDIQGSTA